MTYLQDQYNEMHPKPKTKEEQFHEWLSECPISITDIQDNSLDGYVGYAVDFEIVDSEAKQVKECIIDGNDYSDCVDRMVDTMNSSTPPEVFIPNFHD
tara:strand:+ start:51 stop:344 length:294 start_codon:yes stop_codon:yes gene_type:complete